MLGTTRKNCYKCDLGRNNNPNNQHFWINLKDFEVEIEHSLINIFNKYGNSLTLKYRKELTPNIQFQADRLFVRNDLFEKIIKSCKATNAEFLMLKEKGFCPYEVICDEQDFILMSKIQDTDKELIEESDEELIEELGKELIEKPDEELIEESDEELVEIKCPKKMKIQQIGMINIDLKKY